MTTLERIKDKTEQRAMPSRAEYFRTVPQNYGAQKTANDEEFTLKRGGDFSLYVDNDQLKNDIEKGNPDLLPTGATLKMLGKSSAKRPFDNEKEVSYKVNSKGKLLFSLYAVIVLTLLLVIVLNAVAMERQNTEYAQLQEQAAMLNENLQTLDAQNDGMADEDYILSMAQSYGMIPVEAQSVSISIPQPAEAAQYQPVTNWFDWFCDIISLK